MARFSQMAGALTPAEFRAAVRNFTKLSDKAKAVARGVLVDGKTFEEVTTEHEVSRSLAHQWVAKVFGAHVPDGWVAQVIVRPQKEMDKIIAHEEEWERKRAAAMTQQLAEARLRQSQAHEAPKP